MDGYYIKEDGKTFWTYDNIRMERAHDENFHGMRFNYKRCPFCNRITSSHTLHWLNHIIPCAPLNYTISELHQLRHGGKLEDLTNVLPEGKIAHDRIAPTTQECDATKTN